jgi:uncharacterized membrane protein YvlD (DUF360 family)
MKTSQKLELYTGLMIQPVLLFYLFLSLLYTGFNEGIFFVVWLVSLLITVGAYYQTKKESLFGFWMTFIGGIIMTLFSVMFGFIILYSGGSFLFLFAALILLILASVAASSAVASLK